LRRHHAQNNDVDLARHAIARALCPSKARVTKYLRFANCAVAHLRHDGYFRRPILSWNPFLAPCYPANASVQGLSSREPNGSSGFL
jgi:hypothetical protein